MKITLEYYAFYKQLSGLDHEILQVEEDQRPKDILSLILNKYSGNQSFLEITKYAVNNEYSDSFQQLKDGDILCFIPPVCGG